MNLTFAACIAGPLSVVALAGLWLVWRNTRGRVRLGVFAVAGATAAYLVFAPIVLDHKPVSIKIAKCDQVFIDVKFASIPTGCGLFAAVTQQTRGPMGPLTAFYSYTSRAIGDVRHLT